MSAIASKIELDGVAELQAALRDMPIRVAKTGLRKSVNAGATPIQRTYKANLPKVTGLLKKAVKKKVKFYAKSTSYIAVIGADKNVVGTRNGKKYVPANIAGVVEGGSKAHNIVPTKGPFAGRTLKHPGTKGTKALAEAVTSTAGAVAAAMRQKLAEAVNEAAAKHRK